VSAELNSVLLRIHVAWFHKNTFFLAPSGTEMNHMALEIISFCCGTRKQSKTLSQVPANRKSILLANPFSVLSFCLLSFPYLHSAFISVFVYISAFLSFTFTSYNSPCVICLSPPPNRPTFWGGCVRMRWSTLQEGEGNSAAYSHVQWEQAVGQG
jgi:hypothetical protein